MRTSTLLRLTAALGGLSVALGAFAAHGLERLVALEQQEIFQTGVRYQFYHTLAIGLVAVVSGRRSARERMLRLSVIFWLVGILLFSGSLYLLSLREVHGWPVSFLGPVTPVGGLFLIAGWGALFFSARSRVQNSLD